MGIARMAARLIRRGAGWLTLASALYVAVEVFTYLQAYPDTASRQRLAAFDDNPAVRMLQGVPHAIDVPGGTRPRLRGGHGAPRRGPVDVVHAWEVPGMLLIHEHAPHLRDAEQGLRWTVVRATKEQRRRYPEVSVTERIVRDPRWSRWSTPPATPTSSWWAYGTTAC